MKPEKVRVITIGNSSYLESDFHAAFNRLFMEYILSSIEQHGDSPRKMMKYIYSRKNYYAYSKILKAAAAYVTTKCASVHFDADSHIRVASFND